VTDRVESNERLEFLGDSVLGLAVTQAIFGDLPAEEYDEGRLSRIRAQVVSSTACERVGQELGLSERLREAAPAEAGNLDALLETHKFLASVLEAVIGAAFEHHGFEATAAAVEDAFEREIERAVTTRVDAKSELQERLAQDGRTVEYAVTSEDGPPHDRTFGVAAEVDGERVGAGSGRSKKEAEQSAARAALEAME
jgi:ribonuclease-3